VQAILWIKAFQRSFEPQTRKNGWDAIICSDETDHWLIVLLNGEVDMGIDESISGGDAPISWIVH
jgi:hypothetical protein